MYGFVHVNRPNPIHADLSELNPAQSDLIDLFCNSISSLIFVFDSKYGSSHWRHGAGVVGWCARNGAQQWGRCVFGPARCYVVFKVVQASAVNSAQQWGVLYFRPRPLLRTVNSGECWCR